MVEVKDSVLCPTWFKVSMATLFTASSKLTAQCFFSSVWPLFVSKSQRLCKSQPLIQVPSEWQHRKTWLPWVQIHVGKHQEVAGEAMRGYATQNYQNKTSDLFYNDINCPPLAPPHSKSTSSTTLIVLAWSAPERCQVPSRLRVKFHSLGFPLQAETLAARTKFQTVAVCLQASHWTTSSTSWSSAATATNTATWTLTTLSDALCDWILWSVRPLSLLAFIAINSFVHPLVVADAGGNISDWISNLARR